MEPTGNWTWTAWLRMTSKYFVKVNHWLLVRQKRLKSVEVTQKKSNYNLRPLLVRSNNSSIARVLVRCRDPGLNQGPSDLQSDALPTELSRLTLVGKAAFLSILQCIFNANVSSAISRAFIGWKFVHNHIFYMHSFATLNYVLLFFFLFLFFFSEMLFPLRCK